MSLQAAQDWEGIRQALQRAVPLEPNEAAYRDLLARTSRLTPRVSGRTGTG
ncbi:MAG: hypothetical protein HY332_15800 [Chloroflexi bacterium]|nr:hypothetical protein [Chloroflexota bacterium]